MGTPASLLDLIARGGSAQANIDQRREKAMTMAALANAKQSEAAARRSDVETEKATIEAEAMRQAQADQQVISDAFAHVGGNPALMDKYIRANASGAGVQRWQMENQKIREQTAKAKGSELDQMLKEHHAIGGVFAPLNDIPDDQLQATYEQLAPIALQINPNLPLPKTIDRMGVKRLYGQLQYSDEIAKQAKSAAELEQTRVQTANAQQEGELKQRAAFLQGAYAGQPQAEYAALPGYAKYGKIWPSPAAAMAAARVEGIPIKDRDEAEMKARTLKGTDEFGVSKLDRDKLAQQQKEAEQRAQQHRESLGVTMRGQNMANDRALEAREARPVTEAESKTYGYYKRMNDAEQTISAMAGKMAEKGLFGQAAMKYAPNWLQSEDNQVFEQASRQFTEARLRRDSGAAIPTHEYDNDKRMYFPQPGDTPETQKRKDKARAVVLETMKKEAGRAIERFDGVKVGTGGGSDPNIEQLQKQFPGATITRVP